METVVCDPVMSVTVKAMLQSNWGQKLRRGADGGHSGKPEQRALRNKAVEVPIISHPALLQRRCKVNLSQMYGAD